MRKTFSMSWPVELVTYTETRLTMLLDKLTKVSKTKSMDPPIMFMTKSKKECSKNQANNHLLKRKALEKLEKITAFRLQLQ